MRTIYWDGCIKMIDQTKLPDEFTILEINDVDDLIFAIQRLSIRGAPALEAAGGYGVVLACYERDFDNSERFKEYVKNRAEKIERARPTAVNLSVGVKRVLKKVLESRSIETAREVALREAERIACETRPLNQGSRLTTWELMNDGIDVTLITDSMAGIVMQKGMIDKVIVGADRIVRDGVFNKIGTYALAVLAKEHGIPFFVAAPLTTFDWEKEMKDVVIEERSPEELKFCHIKCKNCRIAPDDVKVYNPAFDATPLKYVTALITEKGVIFPPYDREVPKILRT
jgi:methylthioribose-1-phosphate isomerase